ncbi:GGDEF domain-containing protein [Hydrogenimonas thermophila]|uniref:diguanylate cyclase n=1 Tax=Hydrogenimonas thermophila TaxID=223786 RepID=A0A1I5MAC2_9BACT|nr:GGDEF domain-containing protein [Hydrogenimonas thermophila]SFP06297.1 diguanylate cyclase (GGDEF) domain-containing protein [Hydrogenimonas thermophila]
MYNRRKINELLKIEFNKAKRYGVDFCVAIMDIDFFKSVNDEHGHSCGDNVLKQFSELVKNSIRDTDIFGRWGGEEFILIFTHSNLENAFLKCEHLRETIENRKFDNINITCSIGLVAYNKSYGSVDDLLEKSDQALYKAKESGRNKVMVFK